MWTRIVRLKIHAIVSVGFVRSYCLTSTTPYTLRCNNSASLNVYIYIFIQHLDWINARSRRAHDQRKLLQFYSRLFSRPIRLFYFRLCCAAVAAIVAILAWTNLYFHARKFIYMKWSRQHGREHGWQANAATTTAIGDYCSQGKCSEENTHANTDTSSSSNLRWAEVGPSRDTMAHV